MSGNTLPRPSRPSIAPPSGPLPSLPVAKTRNSTAGPASRVPSSSFLPSAAASNRAVSSSPAYRPSPKHNTSPSVPTLANVSPAGSLPVGKSLRKTVSIGAFPQPPRHMARSNPASPLSTSSTPSGETVNQRMSSAPKVSLHSRDSSLKKPRTSNIGGARGLLPKSPLAPTSFLNGSVDSVAVDTSHLSLPSPPQSRNSSPQGSYATSATTFEDIDDESRGRSETKNSSSKDGKGNVIVSVRVRPDVGAKDSKQEMEWGVDNKRALVSYRGREGGDYVYDNVFDTQDNNARVYDAAAKRLVRRVMEGYHGTVFAYGMTGTGKTFSMQGTATNPGVIPLAITDIFSYIRETPYREFLLRVSYLEIYNEKINDLLAGPVMSANGQPGQQEEIKLREDSKRGVYATPLKEEIVQSPTQLLRVIARGDNARRVAGTQFNAHSSRSHAVVQIVVESRERAPGPVGDTNHNKRSAVVPGGVRVSTLSLIDLAGSEKAADEKVRRTEGAHINKSLLTLGTVIGRLASDKEKAEKNKGKGDTHLPYRDSKLTRLLQPALSGNSLVSILCTIQIGASGSTAAASNHTGETLNTLKFASRAKNNIVSHAKKADESMGTGGDAGSRALLDRYRLEIQELKKQLEGGKAKETKEEYGDELQRDREEERARELEDRQRHHEQILEMQLARTALKERIEHLNRLILSSKSLGVNNSPSFSSLSFHRGSVFSNTGDMRPSSIRSCASHATLEVPRTSHSHHSSAPHGLDGSEEDDSVGENGDGSASQGAQIHALQADLADRNRYITTLEKRLLQARRSSHSRVSMSIRDKLGSSEDGGLLATIAERDAEISSLRAQLEDKERMIAALTSARKKNENAHDVGSDGSPGSRRTSMYRRSNSEGSSIRASGVSLVAKGPTSPTSPKPFLPPPSNNTGKNIEEMTRMLDEMITGRVDRARRSSLMPVSEGR
ncbi:kinesin-domain-containing protein [Dothidotthia symphoricarpi CBS 119687]|uniref:Kinesin-like protein n=1 Tax=Dothidotthia symphoricarpi CBS 119687 TaxID=1392245 RepID=A0A6A6ATF1_9PLEO|nr:kinesin-domain-containing protein [Dothidotthia symphoricarpi CBS 119687]KAF2134235.1 kinesin-domain-containing protein [Dothidotthia symphoricarpi CBS 119687]